MKAFITVLTCLGCVLAVIGMFMWLALQPATGTQPAIVIVPQLILAAITGVGGLTITVIGAGVMAVLTQLGGNTRKIDGNNPQDKAAPSNDVLKRCPDCGVQTNRWETSCYHCGHKYFMAKAR